MPTQPDRPAVAGTTDDQSAQLRLAMDAARMTPWEWRFATNDIVATPELCTLFGVDRPDEVVVAFRSAIVREDREALVRDSNHAIESREDRFSSLVRLRTAPQGLRWLEVHGAVEREPDGTPRRIVGVLVDVSERERLGMQLRHAQKMEAIGLLAGGIAHDFNNLLTVIGTSAAFLRDNLPPDMTECAHDAEQIGEAVRRAAALTHQLLLFSRRESPTPSIVRIDRLVDSVNGLLTRLVGDNIGVTALLGAPDVTVLVDPGQLEQVVLNLAVNARDAMPGGGALTIETGVREVDESSAARLGLSRAGSYATLSVSDTGVGMDDATQARVFEPFFTTKAPGHGTGLGLATVYGIVTASGGTVLVTSEPGCGTTFLVLLPVDGAPEPAGREPIRGTPGTGETILVVEDEQFVRASTVRALTHLGYRVIEARHGQDALRLWQAAGGREGRIDLVLSDMMMPEMGGLELALELLERHPRQRILFMTGYADGALRAAAKLAIPVLAKPFAAAELSQAVGEKLRHA